MSRALLICLLLLTLGQAGPAAAGTSPPRPAQPLGEWPLEPEPSIVHSFEPPSADWLAGHRGVDLSGRPGQAVRSALDGRIGFVGVIGAKPVVTVLHGDRRTTYEPVEATVTRGQEVRAGEAIGRLVTRSGHCFPETCLHWGLREGGTYLDPLSLVGGGAVRLLPLWRETPVAAAVRSPTSPRRTAPLLATWPSPLQLLGALRLRLSDEPAGRPAAAGRW